MFYTLFVLDCVHIITEGGASQDEAAACQTSSTTFVPRFVKSRLASLRLLPQPNPNFPTRIVVYKENPSFFER
jgi:hypothetical protein